jgi:RecJ-like exonuclease
VRVECPECAGVGCYIEGDHVCEVCAGRGYRDQTIILDNAALAALALAITDHMLTAVNRHSKLVLQ